MLRFYRIAYMVIENGNNEPNKHYFVVLNQLNIKMARYYNILIMIIVLITILRTFVYVQNHNSKNNNNINI